MPLDQYLGDEQSQSSALVTLSHDVLEAVERVQDVGSDIPGVSWSAILNHDVRAAPLLLTLTAMRPSFGVDLTASPRTLISTCFRQRRSADRTGKGLGRSRVSLCRGCRCDSRTAWMASSRTAPRATASSWNSTCSASSRAISRMSSINPSRC